jgi:hypothetical protein
MNTLMRPLMKLVVGLALATTSPILSSAPLAAGSAPTAVQIPVGDAGAELDRG